jgi:beta-fructofuranosidase
MADLDAKQSASQSPAPFGDLRNSLASDRHRPLYHFVAPGNWMNDPNGAFFWKGKYHLFYQYNPNGPFWGTIHWGHAVSADLVHWEDYPIALTPSAEAPDHAGCWSGCVVSDGGVPTALYTAAEPQTVCLATGDDDLRLWTKRHEPVICAPPKELPLTGFPSLTGHPSPDFRDPYVWSDEERWYLLIGAGMREKGGTALLYESEDLRHWRYLHPILTSVVGADCNMWECPVLLRCNDRCVLFVSPHPEAKYVYWLSGTWRDGFLHEQRRGKLDLGACIYAVQCLHDPVHDRHLIWTWVKEGRPAKAQHLAGWSGVISLPKECSIDMNGNLRVKPAGELVSLRTESRTMRDQRLTPSSENPFLGFEGDGLEVEVELSFDEPAICELCVRASPDKEERTSIIYDSARQTLTVDGSHSSIDPTVDRPVISGHLGPDHRGVVYFHLFLDRSVLEVFVADLACITQRLYPQRTDSLGLSFEVKEGSARIHTLSAWKMASIWPDTVVKTGVAEQRTPLKY